VFLALLMPSFSGVLTTSPASANPEPETGVSSTCSRNVQHAAIPDVLGFSYDAARNKILAMEWKPRLTREPDGSMKGLSDSLGNETEFWSRGYKEVELCAPTGNSPCNFYFTDKYGNLLLVGSIGEERPDENVHAVVNAVKLMCPKK
jgi:hypothetical protein